MFTVREKLEAVKLDIQRIKSANMLMKPKLAEEAVAGCVDLVESLIDRLEVLERNHNG
ncbi:hypothetical protein [Thalassotalea eurytherma]|uniref:Aspartyl-phosphate phosphatase Spo0E family protein n=1 Tax=Thalassotalea eurytherma TaxID=1144278 RepID=A0ABQ6H233_9GAMM|nr:hypothetical protein [Thalassotalea eurytherma]GLX80882.1 hypothetical protein theurythT_03340 [Thalassotalea eurytherma]